MLLKGVELLSCGRGLDLGNLTWYEYLKKKKHFLIEIKEKITKYCDVYRYFDI